MGLITLLDQETINKIAAGEVVERPSAVVKELVENAIDAGANAVTIEIKEGGISFIRITDNGRGIAKEDVRTAFLRHATSKIKSVEDLMLVSSLGFRGEALSSIAAVSFVELVTKQPGEMFGTRYVIEGGKETSFEEIGCPEGTTFIVRNLFYNTPARRKFLKSATTEAGYISDLIERMAVSHPNVAFRFINNNQLKLNTSGNNKIKDIIYHVYGRDVANNLLPIEAELENVHVQGFIGKPSVSRGNRNYENYYINGRYIKSPIINKAIEEAYKSYSMSHRYPFTALHFTMDSAFLDVNVHPTKMEVRFRNSDIIYDLTYETIRDALQGRELIPKVTLDTKKEQDMKRKQEFSNKPVHRGPEPFEKERIKQEGQLLHNLQKEVLQQVPPLPDVFLKEVQNAIEEQTLVEQQNSSIRPEEVQKQRVQNKEGKALSFETNQHSEEGILKEAMSSYLTTKKCLDKSEDSLDNTSIMHKEETSQIELFEERFIAPKKKHQYQIIGQLFKTYWIVEFNNQMLIIDQHVAHEKVLFEKLLKQYQQKERLSQMVMPPIILSLNPREEEALKKHLYVLEELGFEIEPFGGKEYSVRAVPSNLLGVDQRDVLIEFIDELVESNASLELNIILEKVASMSCKAAIKGGQKITAKEFEALLDELMELENPYFCPHGRPIIISMSKTEIEKKFKRIV